MDGRIQRVESADVQSNWIELLQHYILDTTYLQSKRLPLGEHPLKSTYSASKRFGFFIKKEVYRTLNIFLSPHLPEPIPSEQRDCGPRPPDGRSLMWSIRFAETLAVERES